MLICVSVSVVLWISSVRFNRAGAEQVVEKAQTDVPFASCTNMRVLDHLQELETFFNVPVICSSQALFLARHDPCRKDTKA